ncbi:hypothetical protein HYV86_03735 [Candidatus Woesearchaeota archaeon]|nr:hypothetical protein [Candidatus Woesearchaeota archaeon]
MKQTLTGLTLIVAGCGSQNPYQRFEQADIPKSTPQITNQDLADNWKQTTTVYEDGTTQISATRENEDGSFNFSSRQNENSRGPKYDGILDNLSPQLIGESYVADPLARNDFIQVLAHQTGYLPKARSFEISANGKEVKCNESQSGFYIPFKILEENKERAESLASEIDFNNDHVLTRWEIWDYGRREMEVWCPLPTGVTPETVAKEFEQNIAFNQEKDSYRVVVCDENRFVSQAVLDYKAQLFFSQERGTGDPIKDSSKWQGSSRVDLRRFDDKACAVYEVRLLD